MCNGQNEKGDSGGSNESFLDLLGAQENAPVDRLRMLAPGWRC
jgi:hypothetical protein